MQTRFSAAGVVAPRLFLVVTAIAALSGCALRKPFEATVVAAGANPKKVKVGIFRAEDTLPPATEGGAPVSLSITTDQASQGRALFSVSDAAVTEVALKPLQIDDESIGHTTIDLLTSPPGESLPIHIFAWVDDNDDDQLNLSSEGLSEVARTIYKFNPDSNGKAVLTFYNFNAESGDPFYTATALEGSTNVIVSEDTLKGWMSVLPGDTEEPALGGDTDGDGLSDPVESRLGTSVFEVDTDFDGENDDVEVGDDDKAPLDADADGLIDAVESSLSDGDADGVDAEHDADDFSACVPDNSGDFCDTDADGLLNADERNFYGTDPAVADTDGDGENDGAEGNNDADFDGKNDARESGTADADGDGTVDELDVADDDVCAPTTDAGACDTDADGIINSDEDALGLNKALGDSDGDGHADLVELGTVADPVDSNDDGTIDALDDDSDGDGVLDVNESEVDGDADGIGAWRDADET